MKMRIRLAWVAATLLSFGCAGLPARYHGEYIAAGALDTLARGGPFTEAQRADLRLDDGVALLESGGETRAFHIAGARDVDAIVQIRGLALRQGEA